MFETILKDNEALESLEDGSRRTSLNGLRTHLSTSQPKNQVPNRPELIVTPTNYRLSTSKCTLGQKKKVERCHGRRKEQRE